MAHPRLLRGMLPLLLLGALATASRGGATLDVLPPAPTWSSNPGNHTEAVALGDVDRDGDLDLVCGNLIDGGGALYLNRDGVLSQDPAWVTQGFHTRGLALADIDGDGALDLILAHSGPSRFNRSSLYLNDQGTFAAIPAWNSADSVSWSVATGDVDRDGDLDVVFGNGDFDRGIPNTLYRNAGGTLESAPAWTSATAHFTLHVALGDIDGDGYVDLVCGNRDTSVTMYRNLAGTFTADPVWSSGPSHRTNGVALGDVDGDGDLDLVCGNEGPNTLYLNTGGVMSIDPVWVSPDSGDTQGVALVDVDGDGDLDLAAANYLRPDTVHLNEGGVFTGPAWSSRPSHPSLAVAAGDVDGDGVTDLAFGNIGANTLYRGQGIALQTAPGWTSNVVQMSAAVALGDVDGDGDLDAVIGNGGRAAGRNALYLNEGGRFADVPVWESGPAYRTRKVVLGDIDGDGALDVACENDLGEPGTLYRNLGGTFSTDPVWTAPVSRIALGDVDGDGDLDLVSKERALSLYRNEGGMLPADPSWVSSEVPTSMGSLVLGDINGDGALDAIHGSVVPGDHYLYLNEGGVFSAEPVRFGQRSQGPGTVALGDIDGDGDLDYVDGGASSAVYLNEGGTFGSEPDWQSNPDANLTWSVAVGDLDGDGDLDLVAGNQPQNVVFINERGRLSSDPGWWSDTVGQTGGVALGDLDNDGDLDLVCANGAYSNGQPNTVFYNTARPPYRGDPESPAHHHPNNPAFLEEVRTTIAGDTVSVLFRVVDVESDPVWIVPEYHGDGDLDWRPVSLPGPGPLGPLASSPSGAAASFVWDISQIPFDIRETVLRLEAVSHPARSGLIRHVAAHHTNLGVLRPRRPELGLDRPSISFPVTSVGDTVRTTLTLRNIGTLDLRVEEILLPEDMGSDASLPLQLPPQRSSLVNLAFHPTSESPVPESVRIVSNDRLNPSRDVPVVAPIRPVAFQIANLYPSGVIPDGSPLSVSITMQDSVRADSARVLFRKGGESEFTAFPMIRLTDPVNEQHFGTVDGSLVTVAGIEYKVSVFKGGVSFEGPLTRLRVRAPDLVHPEPLAAETYRMISFPLEVDGSISLILGDDVQGAQGSGWRMFTYLSADSAYAELPSESIFTLDNGRAYWMISRRSVSLDTAPATGLSASTDSAYAVVLQPGWNQIANPFAFPVSWQDVRAASGDPAALEDPWRWAPVGQGEYRDDVSVLDPFDGYWVMNNDPGPVILRVPPVSADVAPMTVRAASGEPGWRVTITASSLGLCDPSNTVGVAAGAAMGRDRRDRSDPPLGPGPGLSLYLIQEWGGSDFFLGRDIRPYGNGDGSGEGHRWRFDVLKNFAEAGAADVVVLTFAGLEDVPPELAVSLRDRILDREVDLREAARRGRGGYRFYSGKRSRVCVDEARFELWVAAAPRGGGWEGEPVRVTRLRQNRPNPARSGTVIRYEIAVPGPVEITIFDVQGRRVKVFDEGHRDPGRYEVAWTGTADDGRPVLPGVYFYRLRTPGFTETRKLIRL